LFTLTKIRKYFSLLSVLVILTGIIVISNVSAYTYPYQDPALTVEERINDLLPRMTLDEKVGQMIQSERLTTTNADVKTYFLGSILSGGGSVPSPNTPTAWCDMIDAYQTQAMATRLQIPFIYGADAVHGHNNVSGATIFPHNIGMGATRDIDLVQRMGQIVGNEVRATGVHWTFAPCIAVPQNEKWGRTYEGYGEDTTLVSQMGVAYVKGVQGVNYPGDLKGNDKIAACIKHYIGDGATDGGVNASNATMTDTVMRQKYLPPYTAGINAGARTVMISYNQINGLECHENYHIITDILKNELGFTGFVVSDWDGINDNDPTYRTAVKEAVNAGLDMIMVPNQWKECITDIKDLVNTSEVSIARIDDAVRRILRVKFQMGLFETPYTNRTLMSAFGSSAHRDVAREAVRKSLVLLKNSNNILPLAKTGKKIFVAGKCADNIGYQCGGWTMTWQGGSGNITAGTSILQGIRNVATGDTVTFSQTGTGAAGNDVAIVVIGETPYAEGNGDNQTLALDSTDTTCLTNVKNSGIPMVVVLVSGRPMIVTSQVPNWNAFVAAWLPGTEGQGVAQVLFGDYNFSGKLPHVWPQSASQIPISPGDGQTPLYDFGAGLVYGATPPPTSTPAPTSTPTITPTPAPGGNRALNKPATASSVEAVGNEAGKAVDGSTTTRWSSVFSDPQWIYVDLGTSYNVNHVKLNWEAAYGKSYKIQVSNDATTWTDVYSTTTGDGGIDDLTFTAVGARYVRMYGTQRSTAYGYSLYEFEVYDSGGPTPTPTPTAAPTPTPIPGSVWYQNFESGTGFTAGTSATVVIDNSSANTGGAKSVKMTITASGDPGNNTKCVNVTPQAGSTFNATGKNYFIFFIKDTQGANTHRVTMVDSANAVWSGWTADKSVLNAWTRITLPMSSVTGINKAAIKEIRLGEWNAGTYYFDDLFFAANATDAIPVF
jgi:beta-glucosidase